MRFAFVLLLVYGASVGCHKPSIGEDNVILIMVDTLRADRLSGYGYEHRTSPNLDALGEQGAVFLRHFSHASGTRESLPTLFYSRYFSVPLFPYDRGIPLLDPEDLFRTLDDEAISIPAALRENNYRTAAISAHTWIKPWTDFAKEFDEFHDLSDVKPGSRYPHPRAEEVIDFAIDWVREGAREPWFLYLHLMDVHEPRYFDDNARLFIDEEHEPEDRSTPIIDNRRFAKRPPTAQERPLLDAIYAGAIRYTDRHLGRLFDFLRSADALDTTLIAITSDHGEMLWDRGQRLGHLGPLYEPLAHVPLIVSYPKRIDPGRTDGITEMVDVFPTLLGALDLELPAGRRLDGVDLQLSATGKAVAKQYALSRRGVRGDRFRLVLLGSRKDILAENVLTEEGKPSGELYDLQADPRESTNLWSSRPETVERMLAEYRNNLMASYRRYENARIERMPPGGFAISANAFETVPSDPGPRWTRDIRYFRSFLQSEPGAPPIDLGFHLPSGRYRVTIEAHGVFQLDIGEQVSIQIKAQTPETIHVGEVHVTDDCFVARVAPRMGRLELRSFGFQPLDDTHNDDPERVNQLEALGYMGE